MLFQQFFYSLGNSRPESWGAAVFRHRLFFSFAASVGMLAVAALPAQAATPVQKKSVTGPHGRTGSVARFSGSGGNSVTLTANDNDGPGGACTETWVDYSTKPHEHWNPGVFVNCSGGNGTVSNA